MTKADTHPGFAPSRNVLTDDSGAIMVLGIFMCTFLVGALWYLAGLGDAIVFRERVQEASDAAGFSGAVLHARGMNLIVLLNLIMACILGIRVALKVLQMVCLVLGAVFAAISFFVPPAGAVSTALFTGAGYLQQAINITREPINKALKALSITQKGIGRAVPAAASLGSYQVGDKFKSTRPRVTLAAGLVSARVYANGLPIVEGSPDKLCKEAGRAVGTLVGWAMDQASLGAISFGKDRIGSMLASVANASPMFFCEMGNAGNPPNFDSLYNDTAEDFCDKERERLEDEYNNANTAWLNGCARAVNPAACTFGGAFGADIRQSDMGLDGVQARFHAGLNSARALRDTKASEFRGFDYDKCKRDKVKEQKDKVSADTKEATKDADKAGNSGNGMTPKKLDPKWFNGIGDTQVIGISVGDERFLDHAPKFLRIANFRSTSRDAQIAPHTRIPGVSGVGIDIPDAWSQAEYFYDCGGAWTGNDCNGSGEEAMWHFKWRARLRRYNEPYTDVKMVTTALEVAYRAESAQRAARYALVGLHPANAQLKLELGAFLMPNRSVVLH